MEFRLDEAQVGLQETVERYCEDRHPLDTITTDASVYVPEIKR